MATTAEAASHIFLTAARFHDLVAQGVITKAERGAYDLNRVREEYIKNIRKSASGHGKDAAGLSKARAELAREQTVAVALKNAVARGEYVPLAVIQRSAETVFATFRERILSIPGKIASACEMRSRGEVEEIVRDEVYECLDELSGVKTVGESRGDDIGGVGNEAAEAD
jgi:phage terminase Nu1 subunit (DNA packaging protein)